MFSKVLHIPLKNLPSCETNLASHDVRVCTAINRIVILNINFHLNLINILCVTCVTCINVGIFSHSPLPKRGVRPSVQQSAILPLSSLARLSCPKWQKGPQERIECEVNADRGQNTQKWRLLFSSSPYLLPSFGFPPLHAAWRGPFSPRYCERSE